MEIMKQIPDGSVDMVLCDLPYGTTACKWDVVIPFERLWEQYFRIVREDGVIALFSNQPFTSRLILSAIDKFRYRWIWDKRQGSNFQLAKIQPMSVAEEICIFGKLPCANGAKKILRYFPIKEKRNKSVKSGGVPKNTAILHQNKMVALHRVYTDSYPKNILSFKRDSSRVHPTQKPVALCEYLIRTYTIEGETVLDNCMGSGTTGVACVNLKRNFIGIEKEEKYFEIAKNRIEEAERKLTIPKQESFL